MLYLGQTASPAVSARVQAATVAVESALGNDLVDLVPSYASLLIVYDALATDHLSVAHRVRAAIADAPAVDADSGRRVTLPAYYHPEAGADLQALAARAGLTIDQVIAIHAGA